MSKSKYIRINASFLSLRHLNFWRFSKSPFWPEVDDIEIYNWTENLENLLKISISIDFHENCGLKCAYHCLLQFFTVIFNGNDNQNNKSLLYSWSVGQSL